MRILIIGASQGTGALAAQEALNRGHAVTAFARNPQRLVLESPNLARASGSFHELESLRSVIPGHDAVIVTASATSLRTFKENPKYFSSGTENAIVAMKEFGVRRLVILSALGVGESVRLANFVLKALVINWLLKIPFQDHERQEQLVKESGLDWVIARPSRLTDGPARKQYEKRVAIQPVPGMISRADVASFLVDACENEQWVGKAVQLGG